MKKKIFNLLLVLLMFVLCPIVVSAGSSDDDKVPSVPPQIQIPAGATAICNAGTTDGVLYSNQWQFYVGVVKAQIANQDDMFYWKFSHQQSKICSTEGCEGNEYFTTQTGMGLTGFMNNQKFLNLYANGGEYGVYSNEELKFVLERGKCPAYIYVGSSKSEQKVAFIFAKQKIENAKQLFIDAGYEVTFEDVGEDLGNVARENYENHLNDMKQRIQKFKDNNWGNVWNDDCDSFSNFGAMAINQNVTIQYYEKYKKELQQDNNSYDFSHGEEVLAEYKSLSCASKPSDSTNNDPEYSGGEPVYGCDVIPDEIRDWIRDALNLVKYVALVIVIVLGVLDFLKAAGSGEAETMKKAGTDFLKRIIAVVILFLVPVIVDLILNLVEIFGANDTCI